MPTSSSLYRQVLVAARQTFAGDVQTQAAWRQHIRAKFDATRGETDVQKLNAARAEAREVVDVLKRNVVQGKYSQQTDAYQLNITPDKELGSNETIKQGRQKQLDDLRASKGVPACGGGSTSRSSAGPSQARAFSTSARASQRNKEVKLPRPVPHFTNTTVLADGSSIVMHTTSPRTLSRLTRDPTNHPLWNPAMGRSSGAADEESGRLSRFRKRFEGTQEAEEAEAAAAAQVQETKFDQNDLDWMSGGREANPGVPIAKKAKAKGKK